MISILIAGEGPTDCGKIDYETGEFLEGPVEIYIRKILGEKKDVQFFLVDLKDKEKRPKLQRRGKNLRGHRMKAMLLMTMAMERKYRYAAYYSDTDRAQGSDARKATICKARYAELKQDIMDGFNDGCLKNKEANKFRGIAIVPVKMIESWLMGDSAAFSRAFSADAEQSEHSLLCPQQPELDWGAHNDVNSDHPKCRLTRILHVYGQEPNQMTFCQIARNADIETLRRTCPISFADFYEQVKKIV